MQLGERPDTGLERRNGFITLVTLVGGFPPPPPFPTPFYLIFKAQRG